MKEAWLRCEITPGQFSCEYAIAYVSNTGEGFSLFACDYDLQMPPLPAGVDRTQGWIRVQVMRESGAAVLVRLPQSTMENGDTVVVSKHDLKVDAGCPEPAR